VLFRSVNMVLTCLFVPQNCTLTEAESCIGLQKQCQEKEFCISTGFLTANNESKIMYANCFEDPICRGKDQCFALKSAKVANDHFYCCCTHSMCNRNYTIIDDTLKEENITHSQMNPYLTHSNFKVTLFFLTILIVIGVIGIVFAARTYVRKRKKTILGQKYSGNNNNNNVENFTLNELTKAANCNKDEQLDEKLPLLNLEVYDLNKIRLFDKISDGHLSIVWKGKFVDEDAPEEDTRVFAVKIFTQNEKVSWQNERGIYSFLNDEFILKFIYADMFNNSDTALKEYWLLSEYQENGCLYSYLKEKRVNWQQICNFTLSILNGLAYLHREIPNVKNTIAHRDIKSKNILVKTNGTCCIADFGLAIVLKNGKLNDLDINSQVGTRRYMPPELLDGAITFNKETLMRIDVYSCALVLWELISRADFYENLMDYELPYQKEAGNNPSLEEMHDLVTHHRRRPVIQQQWLEHHDVAQIAKTIEECWDSDVEARLSSECAASRLRKIISLAPRTM